MHGSVGGGETALVNVHSDFSICASPCVSGRIHETIYAIDFLCTDHSKSHETALVPCQQGYPQKDSPGKIHISVRCRRCRRQFGIVTEIPWAICTCELSPSTPQPVSLVLYTMGRLVAGKARAAAIFAASSRIRRLQRWGLTTLTTATH